MAAKAQDKLTFDAHLVDVYLTGLQSEVEAKLRRVGKFREHMQTIDAAGARTDRAARKRAAAALISQVEEMLDTNKVVRGTLEELLEAARAVQKDLEELPD